MRKKFINDCPNFGEWKLINNEKFRCYDFGNNNVVIINKPFKIFISENGHRIFDYNGVSHYIPKGWIHLWWEAKRNQANFIF